MAKLFQSEWNEIKTRRGVQDLNDLIARIEEDGSIEIVDDPTEDEIKAARDKAAKDAEKQQAEAEKEQEKAEKEAEKEQADANKAAETQRVADQPHPDDAKMDDITENPPEGSDVAREREVEDKPRAASKK